MYQTEEKTITCPECDGTGYPAYNPSSKDKELLTNDNGECFSCNGTGKVVTGRQNKSKEGEMKGKLLYAVYDDVARVWKSFPSLSEAVDWRRKKAPHALRILINVRHVGKEYNYSAGNLLFETNHLEG